MRLIHKLLILFILLSIPLNFIVLDGVGNLYLSTIILLFSFMFLLIKTDCKIILKPNILLLLIALILIICTTFINVIFNDASDFNSQSIGVIIYLQNFLGFMIFYYLINQDSYAYFLKIFLTVTVLACIRVLIEESDKIFLFSTTWGERIEAHFIGAMNNFALICGLAFFISFYFIKKTIIKVLVCSFLFFMIAVSMSRGAFLGVLFTLFAIVIYDLNKRNLKMVIKFFLVSLMVVIASIFYFDKSALIFKKIQDRFLSVFSGEKDLSTFSSGRLFVWQDILERFSKSNIFEILFGHGVGSIDFKVKFVNYHSSHNIFIDLLYKNGIVIFVLYLLVLIYICYSFLKDRNKKKIMLFALFFFLHFEILFNPFPFAAQTGWLYFVFLALFIKQKQLISA